MENKFAVDTLNLLQIFRYVALSVWDYRGFQNYDEALAYACITC